MSDTTPTTVIAQDIVPLGHPAPLEPVPTTVAVTLAPVDLPATLPDTGVDPLGTATLAVALVLGGVLLRWRAR